MNSLYMLFIFSYFRNFVNEFSQFKGKWKCKKSVSGENLRRKKAVDVGVGGVFTRNVPSPYLYFREYWTANEWENIFMNMTIPLLIMWLWTRIWLCSSYECTCCCLFIEKSDLKFDVPDGAWRVCCCRCISLHCSFCLDESAFAS